MAVDDIADTFLLNGGGFYIFILNAIHNLFRNSGDKYFI